MAATNVRSANQALVSLANLTDNGAPVWFAAQSGGEVSSESTEFFDGGSKTAESTGGRPTRGNVTLTLLYRPVRHAAKIKRLEELCGSYRDTITIRDTDPDLNPLAGVPPTIYPDALLVRVGAREFDANSTDRVTCELEFKIDRRA